GLSIRIAKAVNRVLNRCGKVFGDRYHARALKTPRETRFALRYVLLNIKKHLAQAGKAGAERDRISGAQPSSGRTSQRRASRGSGDRPSQRHASERDASQLRASPRLATPRLATPRHASQLFRFGAANFATAFFATSFTA